MNKLCTPVPHPERPEDWVVDMMITNNNLKMIGTREGLGFNWLRSSRLCMMYHYSFIDIVRFMFYDYYYENALTDKLESLSVNGRK